MSSSNPSRVVQDALYHGDCRAILPQLPAGSVDLVVTDPPYNIASPHSLTSSRGRVVSTAAAWGAWDTFSDEEYRELLSGVFAECFRLLRPGGQLYCWAAAQYIGLVLAAGEAAGFRYRAKLVAVKARPQPSWRRQNWRSSYEECLYFSKGRPWPFHFSGQESMRNVLMLPYEPKATPHPTEKRPAMLEPLIRVSSDPGQVVLDPFLGSGSTAVVAQALGRRYVGIERNRRYLAMARKRLEGRQ
jgi:DNA modification methylase